MRKRKRTYAVGCSKRFLNTSCATLANSRPSLYSGVPCSMRLLVNPLRFSMLRTGRITPFYSPDQDSPDPICIEAQKMG